MPGPLALRLFPASSISTAHPSSRRNAALAGLRAGLASLGATPERQAIQDPMDSLSPVDAFPHVVVPRSASRGEGNT